jgi:hypothetical protein
VPGKAEKAADDKIKPPTWLHGLDLRVRKAGESNFTKNTQRYGMEVFKDENAGNILYITETGAISVALGK